MHLNLHTFFVLKCRATKKVMKMFIIPLFSILFKAKIIMTTASPLQSSSEFENRPSFFFCAFPLTLESITIYSLKKKKINNNDDADELDTLCCSTPYLLPLNVYAMLDTT